MPACGRLNIAAAGGGRQSRMRTRDCGPSLVFCIIYNFGYRRFNLMRASSVVKRQSMVVARWFRSSSQAATSFLIPSLSGILRLRFWTLSARSSISAALSQRSCLGGSVVPRLRHGCFSSLRFDRVESAVLMLQPTDRNRSRVREALETDTKKVRKFLEMLTRRIGEKPAKPWRLNGRGGEI
jgi:hypothetical protein